MILKQSHSLRDRMANYFNFNKTESYLNVVLTFKYSITSDKSVPNDNFKFSLIQKTLTELFVMC